MDISPAEYFPPVSEMSKFFQEYRMSKLLAWLMELLHFLGYLLLLYVAWHHSPWSCLGYFLVVASWLALIILKR